MFKIEILGLRLYGHHGVLEQERVVGNEFTVDVTILFPIKVGVENDELSSTLNYAEVVEVVKREFTHPARLLETVVLRIARTLLSQWPEICGGSVGVTKLAPPIPGISVSMVKVTTDIISSHRLPQQYDC